MTGFDRDGVDSGGVRGFEGGWTDDWNVEAEVLVGFGDFDDGCLASPEFTAAKDGRVGAFKAFDGEDSAFFDDDGLSDIEAAHFFCDVKAEGEIFEQAAVRCGAGEMPFWREKRVHEGGGGKQGDADLSALGGDGSEDTFRVSFLEFGENEEGFDIGSEVEEVFGSDLSGHDGGAGTRFLEVFEQGSQLADSEGGDIVDEGCKFGLGLIEECRGDDAFDSGFPRFLCEDQRVRAVSRDDGEAFRDVHGVWSLGFSRLAVRRVCPFR